MCCSLRLSVLARRTRSPHLTSNVWAAVLQDPGGSRFTCSVPGCRVRPVLTGSHCARVVEQRDSSFVHRTQTTHSHSQTSLNRINDGAWLFKIHHNSIHPSYYLCKFSKLSHLARTSLVGDGGNSRISFELLVHCCDWQWTNEVKPKPLWTVMFADDIVIWSETIMLGEGRWKGVGSGLMWVRRTRRRPNWGLSL